MLRHDYMDKTALPFVHGVFGTHTKTLHKRVSESIVCCRGRQTAAPAATWICVIKQINAKRCDKKMIIRPAVKKVW